jgi:hypothetical protein
MDAMTSQVLEGKSILIVERSHILALELYQALESFGATIIGPICTIDEAVLLMRFLEIDGAVLDKDLADSEELTRLLRTHGVPTVFSCNEPHCQSGRNGCYRLNEVQRDPIILLKNLFPEAIH